MCASWEHKPGVRDLLHTRVGHIQSSAPLQLPRLSLRETAGAGEETSASYHKRNLYYSKNNLNLKQVANHSRSLQQCVHISQPIEAALPAH